MHEKEIFVFMGRSGSGKGTQVNLLKSFLSKDLGREIIHFESGKRFRDLSEHVDNYTYQLLGNILKEGKLAPDFLTEWMFTDFFIHSMKRETNTVIFDGFPRTVKQAKTLEDFIHYYSISKTHVIHIDVSGEEVKRRMLDRSRSDDIAELIDKKNLWYNNNVLPTFQYFKERCAYHTVSVNGEQEIEEVFRELLEKLSLQ